MKDAFGKTLELHDKIIYSVKSMFGTTYVIGTVNKLLPRTNQKAKPDCVEITPTKRNDVERTRNKQPKNTVTYASNVVSLKYLNETE